MRTKLLSMVGVLICLSTLPLASCGPAPTPAGVAVLVTYKPPPSAAATPVFTPTPVAIVATATRAAAVSTPGASVAVPTLAITPALVPTTQGPIPPQTAIIVDTAGEAHKVSALYAWYVATGQWLGKTPQSKPWFLVIFAAQTKNGVTTTEELNVRFDAIRRIAIEWTPDVFCDKKLIRIEKRDGSVILITYSLVNHVLTERLEEKDPQGLQTRSVEGLVEFRDGSIQGQPLKLWGFGGEGNFSIQLCYVQSVEFEGTGAPTSLPAATQTRAPTRQPSATPTPKVQTGTPPILESVNLRYDTSSGSLVIYQDITFHDPDGDSYWVDYELVRTTAPGVEVRGGAVETSSWQQKQGATITGEWTCGGTKYDVTLRVFVLDRAGNKSNPVEYTMSCH